MDITDKFFANLEPSILHQSIFEPQMDYFASHTEQIYNMIGLLRKSMAKKMSEMTSKMQSQGQSNHEKRTDDYQHEIETTINLCKEKIEGIKQFVEQSKNKTERGHKATVLECLEYEQGKAKLTFYNFKLYRQKQKERFVKLTSLNQGNQKDVKVYQQINQVKNPEDPLFQENQYLIQKYNNEIKDVVIIQTQIRDIVQSIQTMSELIARQEMETEEILANAGDSLEHLEKANKHLISSTKMNEQYGRRWGMLFFSMGMILLFYDYINA